MLSALLVLMLQADEIVDFKRDIRPILSNNCFLCHGPDDKRRKGDLRLDTKEGAFKSIEGKHAFVAAKPDQSEALRRILTKDGDDHMPPAKSGKWTDSSRRPTTASAGAASGSTPRATPTRTASRRTSRARHGSTATGSSTLSTATCPTTSSSSNRSPATCCRTPRRIRSWRPA